MRLGGRAAAAIEVLADMETRKRPATDALRDWGLAHRFAGAGDRSAIGNLVFDALRRKASQAWRMDDDSPLASIIATLLDQWQYDAGTLAAQFSGDTHAPQMPDEAQLAAWQTRDLKEAPDWVQADIPQWCAPHFEAQFGSSWIEEAATLANRPPLDMRANTLKASRDKALKALEAFSAKACIHAPDGMRIDAPSGQGRLPNVQAEPSFQKGWFEIQDEGSQLAALATAAAPGEQVLDYCAGGGGKTLALAAMMGNRGQIHAWDSDRHRLAPIHDRLKRAGVRNAQVHHPKGDSLAALTGQVNLVLVDAPCTGSGTWRRKPDARWRLSPEQLLVRQGEQQEVLAAAAQYVRPGGRLVYVTCSLFADENTAQVQDFLSAKPEFSLQPLPQNLLDVCDATHRLAINEAMTLFSPLRTGTDGFFVACMRKHSH